MIGRLNKQKVCVVVFAKTPKRGKVKQRLAKSVGDDTALKVYEELFEITLQQVKEVLALNPLFSASLRYLGERPCFKHSTSFNGFIKPQLHKNMTLNLIEAINDPFKDGFGKTVLLGADHPTLCAKDIINLVSLLDLAPVAVGPTEDGGFWGIATTTPLDKHILDSVTMSTNQTFDTLMKTLKKNGLNCATGPVLWDIDHEADFYRWQRLSTQKKQ